MKIITTRRLQRTAGALGALALLFTIAPSPGPATAAPRAGAEHLIPLPDGPVSAVSTEGGYNAFPAIASLGDKSMLLALSTALGHDGGEGDLVMRSSADGRVWSDSRIVIPANGYSWGPGAMTAETQAQGGRVYMSVQRAHWPDAIVNHPDEQRYWIYSSDDNGQTWGIRGAMFATSPGSWGFGPGSLLVDHGTGELLIGGYTSDGIVRFLRSPDRGGSKLDAGSLSVPGRTSGSPQLGQLGDGRVFVIFRSEAPGTTSRYYYAFRTGAATWTTPALLYGDATTLGGVTVVNDDTIVICYRTWADRTDDGPANRPIGLLLAGVTASGGLEVWRSNVNLNPVLLRRMLGGRVMQRADGGWQLIWGVEGPLTTATSASTVTMPITFTPAP